MNGPSWFVLAPQNGLMDGYYSEKEDAEGSAQRAHDMTGWTFIVARVDETVGGDNPYIPDKRFLHHVLADYRMKNPEKWAKWQEKIKAKAAQA